MKSFDELIATWRRRAEDRADTAARMGRATIEGRIMQADAAATLQCVNELLAVLTGMGEQ
jgi:hypothetical protein